MRRNLSNLEMLCEKCSLDGLLGLKQRFCFRVYTDLRNDFCTATMPFHSMMYSYKKHFLLRKQMVEELAIALVLSRSININACCRDNYTNVLLISSYECAQLLASQFYWLKLLIPDLSSMAIMNRLQ